MLKIKVKKLWNGNVSLRDYQIKEALEKNEDLLIEFDNQSMYIEAGEIKNKMILTGTKVKSKWGDSNYELVDFEWSPNSMRLF